jgi:uncharacterized surface anchored protein
MVEAKIDSEGNYECSGLCSGRYYLQLYSSEQTLAISDAFELGESQHIENIPLKSGTGILQIHLVDSETGQDITNANFTLRNEHGAIFHVKKLADENNWGMSANSRGMAEFKELPPGKYTIGAQASGYLMRQSDLFTVDNDTTTPAMVSMDAAAVVRFELSEQIKPQITAETAYLICQITNLDTQKSVPMDSIYDYGFEDRHLVWLKTGNVTGNLKPLLNLPPGRYEIQYRLYQDKSKLLSYKMQTPLLTGTFHIKLARRDTKTLTIAQGQ